MVLFEESFMRPENTFLDTVFKVYAYDDSTFEQYISEYADTCEVTPSDKGYHYHQGELTDDFLYITDILSASWDSDYEDWSGTCTLKIPYRKKYLDLLIKGAYAELYMNRFPIGTDVEYLRELDAEELKVKKAKAEKEAEEYASEKNEDGSNKYLPKVVYPYVYFYVERSFRGFITDVKYNPDSLEVTIGHYGVLLDESAKLSFTDMYRISILYEVIHTAGLVPNIDADNLPNEIISWSNISSSTTATEGNSGDAITGDDCTDTNTMSCLRGCSSSNKYGSGHNFDDCCKKGYAVEGTEYYNWARKFSSGEEMLRSLRGIWEYNYYRNNRTCPQKLFNTSYFTCNCYDAARMVKVLCDSIGFPCVIVTGAAYGYGHGWNVIKTNGQWLTYDLCFGSKANSTSSTNTSMLF